MRIRRRRRTENQFRIDVREGNEGSLAYLGFFVRREEFFSLGESEVLGRMFPWEWQRRRKLSHLLGKGMGRGVGNDEEE